MDLEKSLLRHLLVEIKLRYLLLLGCVAFLASHLSAQPEGSVSSNAGIDILSTFLESTLSMSAEFQQLLWDSEGQLVEEAEGTLEFRRPNRFVWSYTVPFEQQLVSDGQNLWMYDIDLAQITVTAIDDMVTATPAMLLSGEQDILNGFEVIESFNYEGRYWVELQPIHLESDFRTILLGFTLGDLSAIQFVDGLGQLTEIEFSRVELNPELKDDLFNFIVPEGVAVIGNIANRDVL